MIPGIMPYQYFDFIRKYGKSLVEKLDKIESLGKGSHLPEEDYMDGVLEVF